MSIISERNGLAATEDVYQLRDGLSADDGLAGDSRGAVLYLELEPTRRNSQRVNSRLREHLALLGVVRTAFDSAVKSAGSHAESLEAGLLQWCRQTRRVPGFRELPELSKRLRTSQVPPVRIPAVKIMFST